MKTSKWLLHAITWASGSVRSVPGKHSKERTPRAWVTRGILMMALILGALGAVAAMSSHASAGFASAVHIMNVPWMY